LAGHHAYLFQHAPRDPRGGSPPRGVSCSCPRTGQNIKTSALSLCATPGEYALLL
jgi:hypothetical protein